MAHVHRVVVLDRTTSILLFERSWSSAAPLTNSSGFCNLIQTFFMMSRELNEGGVSFVLFDKAERKARPGQVRLGLARNDNVIVAALHDPTESDAAVQRLLETMLVEFNLKFAEKLKDIRQHLAELASEKAENLKMTQEDVLRIFTDLGSVLDQPNLVVSNRSSKDGRP